MAKIDRFASQLLEEAKRFLEKAKQEENKHGKDAYLHAAILLAFASVEAHINAIADEKLMMENLSVLEKSILAERAFELVAGRFQLNENKVKMYRLNERIEFIYRRFAHTAINKEEASWWGPLKEAEKKRNALVHARDYLEMSEKDVELAINSILEFLNVLYLALYNSKYPAYGRKLHSKMLF